jgi:hypothetical protein
MRIPGSQTVTAGARSCRRVTTTSHPRTSSIASCEAAANRANASWITSSPGNYFTLGTVVRLLGSQGFRKLTTLTANRLFSSLRQHG